MVDFTLTDEQKSLRELAHDFAEKEIRPVAWEYDRTAPGPQEIIEKAWELGLMNSTSPRSTAVRASATSTAPHRGGARLGLLGHPDLARLQRPGDRAAAARRLRGAQEGVPRAAHRGAAARLVLPDRARRRLRRLRDEDPAVRKGDKWVINGSKCFITNGGYANFYTVYAKTDKDAGHRGISCFIVPRDAGVVVDKHEDKMGQRASNTATITFPDVEIPPTT
jgi:acyl-CoA dehydrogenase